MDFIEYLATLIWKFKRPGSLKAPLAPIEEPRGDGDGSASSLSCCLCGISDILPWSLCNDGPLSSWPQPLGRGGDATPCEDTREDFGLSF